MWQDEWPTEPGWWWFYGYRFKPSQFKPNEKRGLYFVEVRKTTAPKVFSYVTTGHWMYKQEGATGKWQKAVLPELPKETNGEEDA